MNNENHPHFEDFLAQAAQPEELEGGRDEQHNNPSLSLRAGLVRLYENYISRINKQLTNGLIDVNKANDLAAQVDSLSLTDLGYEVSKYTSIEKAKELMGPGMFFGPDEVRKTGIEIREEIPIVPFSSAELERAKELEQMLIYRTSTTMKELNDTLSPKPRTQNNGKVLFDTDWLEDEDFYKSDKIQPGWALVSKELNPGSTNKNYLEQSEFLAEYLVNEVYKGKPLPGKYQAAVDQFNAQKEIIRHLMASSRNFELEKGGLMLADLEINELTRQSPAEFIYDCLVYFQNTGDRLHGRDRVWTNAHSPDPDGSRIVFVGRFDDEGASVSKRRHDQSSINVGVSFARRGADLKS